MVDFGLFRWLLIIVSVALSGSVLVKSLWPAVKADTNQLVALGFIAMVFAAHGLLAVSFKEFYFDTAHASPAPGTSLQQQSAEIAPPLPTPAALVQLQEGVGMEKTNGSNKLDPTAAAQLSPKTNPANTEAGKGRTEEPAHGPTKTEPPPPTPREPKANGTADAGRKEKP